MALTPSEVEARRAADPDIPRIEQDIDDQLTRNRFARVEAGTYSAAAFEWARRTYGEHWRVSWANLLQVGNDRIRMYFRVDPR